ncbi:MAG: putative RDD family membrane protein YckC, partial [Rhodoferax sp.]
MTPELIAPSLARRMACWLYEGMLMFGVVFIAGYLFGTLSQTRNAMDNRNALQAFIFVVFGIYFVWLWAKGQTLAMKTWDITVVDRLGQP